MKQEEINMGNLICIKKPPQQTKQQQLQNNIDLLQQLMITKFDLGIDPESNEEPIRFHSIENNKVTFNICNQGGCNYEMANTINGNKIKGLEAEVVGTRNVWFFSSELIKLKADLNKITQIIKSVTALKALKFDHRFEKGF